MPPTFQFTKAARHAVKLKIGIDGPSGSGKTLGALALARGITSGGRVAVADSENDSASLYSDRFDFDRVVIPDANPETYKAIIDAAVAGGYEALVIDSLSHAWLTILAAKEDYERKNPKANSWTLWRVYGPMWEGLMQHILNAPLHIIATMRSKQAYEQVESNGKKAVVKLGMQPQVREGAEYEFGLVFSVAQSHYAEATKDRTALFANRQVDLCAPALHEELRAWMNAGGTPAVAAPARAATPSPAPVAAPSTERTLEWAKALPLPFKNSNAYGTPIGSISVEGLETMIPWIGEKQTERGEGWHADTKLAMQLVLDDLRANPPTTEADDDDVPSIGPARVPDPVTATPSETADALAIKRAKAVEASVSQSIKGDALAEKMANALGEFVVPFGGLKGKMIRDVDDEGLQKLATHARSIGQYDGFVQAVDDYFAEKELATQGAA